MGGSGSGTWCRWNKKTYTEEVKRIDIRYMNKRGFLKPGFNGSLSWSSRGEPSGNINFVAWETKMRLKYRYRINGGEWEPVEEDIQLDQTPCNYGGVRKWFICPSCGQRVGLLYGHGKYFRCRNCSGVTYASQSEGDLDRMCRKARRIRKRLDIGVEWWDADCLADPIMMKPKGMHQKTFDRLRLAENGAQDMIGRLMVARFGLGWY